MEGRIVVEGGMAMDRSDLAVRVKANEATGERIVRIERPTEPHRGGSVA
jgi:hypothetical protein